ncbi:hypothetical protein V6N11_010656 [Hibiscus sabdariffa]|uniref:Uncharacterized protein n=1 Tax=Hibiscus sabdariffa TaxID=183260 RepID=A0ABR2S651_9ROSI
MDSITASRARLEFVKQQPVKTAKQGLEWRVKPPKHLIGSEAGGMENVNVERDDVGKAITTGVSSEQQASMGAATGFK